MVGCETTVLLAMTMQSCSDSFWYPWEWLQQKQSHVCVRVCAWGGGGWGGGSLHTHTGTHTHTHTHIQTLSLPLSLPPPLCLRLRHSCLLAAMHVCERQAEPAVKAVLLGQVCPVVREVADAKVPAKDHQRPAIQTHCVMNRYCWRASVDCVATSTERSTTHAPFPRHASCVAVLPELLCNSDFGCTAEM